MYCAVLDGNLVSGLVASEAGLADWLPLCAAFWVSSMLVALLPISGLPSLAGAAVSVEAGAEVSAPLVLLSLAGAAVSVLSGAVSSALPEEVL